MKVITSPDNKKVKTCQQLGLRKYRDRTGLYLAEGPNLLQEALAAGSDVREVFVEEGSQDAFDEPASHPSGPAAGCGADAAG
jgi:RNA methyltransferase, TrmH family